MTTEQFDKLPKWAQAEFRKLSRQISDMERDLAALRKEQEKSRISYKPNFDGDKIYIKDKETIRFQTSEHGYIDVEFDNYDLRRNEENVGLTIRGSESVVVECNCSNQFTVRNTKR